MRSIETMISYFISDDNRNDNKYLSLSIITVINNREIKSE